MSPDRGRKNSRRGTRLLFKMIRGLGGIYPDSHNPTLDPFRDPFRDQFRGTFRDPFPYQLRDPPPGQRPKTGTLMSAPRSRRELTLTALRVPKLRG